LDAIDSIVRKIRASAKYRGAGVPEATVRSLVEQCAASGGGAKDTEKKARVKLHNIVAPYLGDLDYGDALATFERVKNDRDALINFCFDCLNRHASTRERGADLSDMYAKLLTKLGPVRSVCDLACGLHPIGLPFMGLPADAAYCAYDLHGPRVKFLDAFIKGFGYNGGCFHRDIYVEPPPEAFDAAFFFKEAHRLEKRESGATIKLLNNINAKRFVVSLPVYGMDGRRRLSPHYGDTLRAYAEANGFPMDTMEYNNEMFYIIRKTPGLNLS